MNKAISPSDPRLRDINQFNRLFKTDKNFHDFARQVYSYLDTMKPGRILKLNKYSGQKLEWIVRTACAFMAEGYHWLDFEFSEDYMAIRHRLISPAERVCLRALMFPSARDKKKAHSRYKSTFVHKLPDRPYETVNQKH